MRRRSLTGVGETDKFARTGESMEIEHETTDAALKIVVTGAMGRMGRMFIRHILATPGLALYGAVERHDHPLVGRDIGPEFVGRPIDISLENDLRNTIVAANAVIDFTMPEASLTYVKVCADKGIPYVCGTTGMRDGTLDEFRALAAQTRTVFAPNFSMGVNLLIALTRRTARVLGDDFDIEIVEAHHRHKEDAPSGTALALARAAAEETGVDESAFEYGRQGRCGARESGRIGVLAVRGGDVVGDHDVQFLGDGERLVLTHRASSREVFVRGAIRAALWLQNREPGLYSMMDVLGL